MPRIGILIVAYNAETTLKSVLGRIPVNVSSWLERPDGDLLRDEVVGQLELGGRRNDRGRDAGRRLELDHVPSPARTKRPSRRG